MASYQRFGASAVFGVPLGWPCVPNPLPLRIKEERSLARAGATGFFVGLGIDLVGESIYIAKAVDGGDPTAGFILAGIGGLLTATSPIYSLCPNACGES